VSSFPNINAISQEDGMGRPWLKVSDFLRVGITSTVIAWVSVNTIAFGIMYVIGFH
jgi:phosphate transporter